jgi:hypothetical protein
VFENELEVVAVLDMVISPVIGGEKYTWALSAGE